MVLRESERIRLVFRPLLVDNPHDKKAALKGTFLYQKKSANDERIGFDTISLQKVRQGEGYKLNLSTSEVLQLFQELSALYELHKQMGVPPTYALSLQ